MAVPQQPLQTTAQLKTDTILQMEAEKLDKAITENLKRIGFNL